MSKQPISTKCECQNKILNVKIAYFDSVRMSEYDFECHNRMFPLDAIVKIGFRMSK